MDYEGWMELGELYLDQLEYDKAAFCFEELIVINPYNHLFHLKYADVSSPAVSLFHSHLPFPMTMAVSSVVRPIEIVMLIVCDVGQAHSLITLTGLFQIKYSQGEFELARVYYSQAYRMSAASARSMYGYILVCLLMLASLYWPPCSGLLILASLYWPPYTGLPVLSNISLLYISMSACNWW